MSYDIIRPLGRGGMGEVYLARDLRLDRQVALKTLRRDRLDQRVAERMGDEARLLARLNHPHIVQIHDIIEYEGHPALIMEYVQGSNLHVLQREGRGDYAERLRWLQEISEALAAAHREGIAHRDLKAENVLIPARGPAKVSDFGIGQGDAGKAEKAADMLALGKLGEDLLGHCSETSPTVRHLLARLSARRAGARPDAHEAVLTLRAARHEADQDETLVPAESAGWLRQHWWAAAVLLALAVAVGWRVLAPAPRTHVAILTPVVQEGGQLNDGQLLGLGNTVRQALLQAALAAPGQVVVSSSHLNTLQGSPAQVAQALAAEELLSSALRCAGRACSVHIERLDAAGTVLATREEALPPEAGLESWTVVSNLWSQLYQQPTTAEQVEHLIAPDDYDTYLTLYTQSYLHHGTDDGDILQALEELIPRAPAFLPLHELYTEIALNLYDMTGATRYARLALDNLRQASRQAPDSVLLKKALFEAYLDTAQFEQAQHLLQEIEALPVERHTVHEMKGSLYSYQARFEQANEHYQQALAIRPSRDLYYFAAVNFFEWQRPEEAEALLRRSLEAYPEDASAMNVLGLIHLHRGELLQAQALLSESVQREPSDAAASNLGLSQLLAGNIAAARDTFLSLFSAEDALPIDLLNLADCENLLGNTEAAQALYRRIIEGETRELSPSDYLSVAQAHAQLGQYDRAIASLKKAAGHRKHLSEYNFSAALVYTLAGQDIAALVEIEQALASGFGAIWFTLPWFDALCPHPRFRQLMTEAGAPGHCEAGERAPASTAGLPLDLATRVGGGEDLALP